VDVRVVEVDKLRGRIGLRIIGMEDDEPDAVENGGVAADGDAPPRRRRRRLTTAE
jgi:hypothetical protein